MDGRSLMAIASDVCSVQGYCCESARFVRSDVADISWHRGREGISFEVSDLLRDLPQDVMMDYLDSVMANAMGFRGNVTDSTRTYLGSGGLVRSSRSEYVKRNGLQPSRELDDSVARLRESGHAPASPLTRAYWDGRPRQGMAVRANPAFHAVMVNPALRSADPDLLDYAVYKGVSATDPDQLYPRDRMRASRARDRRIFGYPGSVAMQDRLMAMGLRNRRIGT